MVLRTYIFSFKDFIYLFLERGKGKEKEYKTNINRLLIAHSQPGTWPITQACAPPGNWTGETELSVHSLAVNPLSHMSQGSPLHFNIKLKSACQFLPKKPDIILSKMVWSLYVSFGTMAILIIFSLLIHIFFIVSQQCCVISNVQDLHIFYKFTHFTFFSIVSGIVFISI